MPSLGRREELERRETERAVGRGRGFWHSLSVEEWALLCAAAWAEDEGLEPTPEERAVLDRSDRSEIEGVLRVAIGWREGMTTGEEGVRIDRLMGERDPFDGRGPAIKQRYEELKRSRGGAV